MEGAEEKCFFASDVVIPLWLPSGTAKKIIRGMRADRSKNVHLSRRLHTGKISLLAWRKIFVVGSLLCKVVVAKGEGLGVTKTRSDGLNGPTDFGK